MNMLDPLYEFCPSIGSLRSRGWPSRGSRTPGRNLLGQAEASFLQRWKKSSTSDQRRTEFAEVGLRDSATPTDCGLCPPLFRVVKPDSPDALRQIPGALRIYDGSCHMAKPVICFDCEVGGLIRRLRCVLKIFRGRGKKRHCENCGHPLAEPVESWIRARDAERASAPNPDSNRIRDRPPRPKV